ncbi:MAG: hydrogenase expression/formation protein HypE [Nitrospirae bacterium]|nr:MAG: hydrogenase expression/formation protein HypE [Nitrospirota bacterium]
MSRRPRVLLGHGAGGRLTAELVRELFLPAFASRALEPLSDAAVLGEVPPGRLALTTDAFVVDPPVFPGGDLGHLSVSGTVNDLAVAGARPLALTWAVILEEGAPMELVETCTRGAAAAARQAGVEIAAGDTKVVPRGRGDGIYAATAGIGVLPPGRDPGDHRIRPGDAVIVTGPVGDHGATVMAARHGLEAPGLRSDCAPIAPLLERLWDAGIDVHAMHDPTRGGVATVCAEVGERTGLQVALDEADLPVRGEVAGVCEVLGLDPLYLACEGRALVWVAAADRDRALEVLRGHPLGAGAAVIGRVRERPAGGSPAVLHARSGGARPLDILSGTGLPRIC